MRSLLFAMLILPALALAEWRVEPAFSRVSFVSVKRGEIADVHRFTEVSGAVDAAGAVRVVLPFAALDAGMALQAERMRELLFEVQRFPQTELEAQVDLALWEQLPVGQAQVDTLDFQLSLHGHRQRLKAEVLVSRLAESRIQVVTTEPVLIKAELFALTEGLDKLKQVANLPSIASEVPVSAILDFQRRPCPPDGGTACQ